MMQNLASFFVRGDDWVFDRLAEPFGWWIEYRTGMWPLWQGVYMSIIAIFIVIALEIYEQDLSTFFLMLNGISIFVCFFCGVLISKRMSAHTMSMLRGHLFYYRVVIVSFYFLTLITRLFGDGLTDHFLISEISDVLEGFSLYLFGCRNMPPWYKLQQEEKSKNRAMNNAIPARN